MSTGTAIRDHYQVLGVDRRAPMEVIHAAYRALAALYANETNPTRLRFLNQAKEVLYDEANRRAYDRELNQVTGVRIGNYKVLREIAEGGFGKTYYGEHVLTGGPVCIKQCSNISAEDDEILLNEAQAMWDLRHFAIPSVRDVVRLEDNSLALVTSFIEGLTVEKVVEKIGPIPPEHVAWIVERILNALWYIHEHGVVHGDLKPQNAIIQHKTHMACLVDFGLAMIKPGASDKSKGYTEYFAPPEQMQGKPLVPESDFYSLGIFIIYALTGGNMKHILARNVPASLPDPFAQFIKRLIVRDVLGRPSWEKENLFETFQKVRRDSFGRDHTNMSPIPGL